MHKPWHVIRKACHKVNCWTKPGCLLDVWRVLLRDIMKDPGAKIIDTGVTSLAFHCWGEGIHPSIKQFLRNLARNNKFSLPLCTLTTLGGCTLVLSSPLSLLCVFLSLLWFLTLLSFPYFLLCSKRLSYLVIASFAGLLEALNWQGSWKG